MSDIEKAIKSIDNLYADLYEDNPDFTKFSRDFKKLWPVVDSYLSLVFASIDRIENCRQKGTPGLQLALDDLKTLLPKEYRSW